MLRQSTNENIQVILKTSLGVPVTGLVAADFKASSIYLYKANSTKVTIALTLGANLFEVDSGDAPGAYSIAIPAANLDQLGVVSFSIQPAAAAFAATYLTDYVYVEETATLAAIKAKTDLIDTASVASLADVTSARDSIKGAQLLSISDVAGGASFILADNLHNIRLAINAVTTGIAATVWDELLAGHLIPNSLGELMNILAAVLVNRIKINKVTKTMDLYLADSTTIWKSYSLRDINGLSATINASEREKAV